MGYFITPTKQDSSSGAVFITNIEAQNAADNVSAKVYSDGGFTLNSCLSTSDLIKVSVLAITGYSSFKPIVTVQGDVVSLIQNEDQTVWQGSIDIDLNGSSTVVARHIDGAFDQCNILIEAIPLIENASFSGDYPNGQSELKEGDSFNLQLSSLSPFTTIEVADYAASKGIVETFEATLSKLISIPIADRGNFRQALGIRLRIANENGTQSTWLETASLGSNDKEHLLFLNNQKPQIEINQIEYPSGQEALKDNEEAIVIHSISQYDEVSYQSPSGEISITEANSFESQKSVQRIAGDYNIDVPNLLITATKQSNGATASKNITIKIANRAAELIFRSPNHRLISGGNQGTDAQIHELIIEADQQLLELPSINIPSGTLEGDILQNSAESSFTQTVSIHDDDSKGIHQASLIRAKNLAGIPTDQFSGNANYEIGGFVRRELSFAAFSKETAIGTSVVDFNKLIALDKDQIQMQKFSGLEDHILGFSITGPSQSFNPNGNLLFWNDVQAVNNNSTGLTTISLEESP